MRVLFVEVDTENEWAVASIGPAFLAPVLRARGHEPLFLRAPAAAPPGEVALRAGERRPDLVGLSLTSRQWQRARALVREIRRALDVPVVAGGLHPTFAPEEVLRSDGFDFACIGEGEEAMADLADALARGGDGSGIPNMQARGAPRPPLRPPFEPLDALPFLDRAFLDEPPGVVHVATQRGCPFPCTYCAARMFNRLYAAGGNEYGRRRSPGNVLAELRGLRDAGRLSYVIFLDDTFTIHHPWVREFCRVYGSELRAPFSLHARVETVDEALLRELAAAGCRHITYGVESGSERVRREVMHRPVTNRRFREVFRWTKDAGILVTANYMMGLPGETREDLEATLRLAEELDAFDFGYFVFYPFPGTRLFEVCRDAGYLPADCADRPVNHRESILDLPGLSKADVAEFYGRFMALRERLYRDRAGGAPGAADHVAARAAIG